MCKWTDPVSEDSVKPLSTPQTGLRAHHSRDTPLCPILWVRKEPGPSAWAGRVPSWCADEGRETAGRGRGAWQGPLFVCLQAAGEGPTWSPLILPERPLTLKRLFQPATPPSTVGSSPVFPPSRDWILFPAAITGNFSM